MIDAATPLLRIHQASVHYGATVALDSVDLDVLVGEVHALVGENGAGKSTLLRLATGLASPGGGAAGVAPNARLAWAPQEPSLAPDLTAGEWVFLGRELRGRFGLLRRAEMAEQATAALRRIGSRADGGAPIASLAAAERKQVQLARAVASEPDLLLLDEPTAALGTSEAESLFEELARMRARGCGILYVTHRLDEVRRLADRVTVLRDGRRISTDAIDQVDAETVVRRMVGRDLAPRREGARRAGEVVLRVAGLTAGPLTDVRLDLRRGEIVGLAGLVGAGRSELLEAIAGLTAVPRGSIECAATPVLVPEDRGGKGLVPTFGVRENLFLPADGAWLDRRGEVEETRRWIGELGIRAAGVEAPIDSLSGGNQQKLLLARALRHRPALLLLDEPTAGVDVGAKADIHALVRSLGDAGTGVLLASSDLPELLSLCDRILALREGRIIGELSGAAATEERLVASITGMH